MDFSAGLASVVGQIGGAIGIWKSKVESPQKVVDPRDPMRAAAEDYVVDTPMNEFDDEENPPILQGDLHELWYNPDEPEFLQAFMVMTETCLRIYDNELDFYQSKEEPQFQIPIKAIKAVHERVIIDPLKLDFEDSNTQEFFENIFYLELEENFLPIYLSTYYQPTGLNTPYVDQLELNEQTQMLIKFYNTLQSQLLDEKFVPNEEQEDLLR